MLTQDMRQKGSEPSTKRSSLGLRRHCDEVSLEINLRTHVNINSQDSEDVMNNVHEV